MEGLTLAIIVVLVLAVAVFLYSQIKSLKEKPDDSKDQILMEWLKSMKAEMTDQLKSQRDTLNKQLSDQRMEVAKQSGAMAQNLTQALNQQLNNTQEVIRNVQKQLGGIEEFGKDIKDLSNVLKSPKLRGGLGEQFLYEILANVLPKELYATQYKFKDGTVCDAVVFTDKGMIPVDSKFPLEKYKLSVTTEHAEDRERAKKEFTKAVKDKVDEIAGKYILPAEGTTENAVMYIPSETVFYDMIVNTPVVEEYARNKNVMLASPNTVSYFLKVVLVAYKQQELQKHALEIQKALAGIKIEAEKFNDDLGVLERHISNAYKSMDGVKSRFGKFFNRLENVQSVEGPKEQSKLL
ncbi:MAG: DNA recombination protein RmuC [bacterium]